MQQTMQRFKEKLQSNDATLDNTTRIRAAAALIALFSMLVPWVWMDGDKSALSGSDLLAYAFTSDERGALFRTSILGALGLFFVPPIVAVLTIYGFAKTIMGEYPLMANLMGALLPSHHADPCQVNNFQRSTGHSGNYTFGMGGFSDDM